MTTMRARAKAQLPGMLMTLLSIIQALSLELVWSRLGESPFLWSGGVGAVVGWMQVVAILLGIILVWVFYMSIVMRFSWIPSTRDSVNPFIIGLLEFSMVSLLGPGLLAYWLLCMAALFAVSTTVSNDLFRRARRDPENDDFFRHVKPASLLDVSVSYGFAGAVGAFGLVIAIAGEGPWLSVAALGVTIAVIGVQIFITRYFWTISMLEEESLATRSDESTAGERPESRPVP